MAGNYKVHNAEAQLPPEQPKAAKGTRSAAALLVVNGSNSLADVTDITSLLDRGTAELKWLP